LSLSGLRRARLRLSGGAPAWLVGQFTVTGSLDVTVPIQMLCLLFGLSMD
jgi:hypothetical protein